MKSCFVFLLSAAVLVLTAAPRPACAEERLKVVATLSTFADLARTIGGDAVEVASIASAKFDPHFIEPRPSDVLRVKRARLLIHAGLDLEAWRGPLLDAAGNREVFPGQNGELDLSRGMDLLEVPDRAVSRSEGDIHLYGNPHYWVDPENGRKMAAAIAEKFSATDPAREALYRKNLSDFLARLDSKLSEWNNLMQASAGTEIVGYHNAWPYLMRFAGLRMERFLEPKPGIPPTPKQVELLDAYVRERRIRAIVQPGYAPRQAADALAKRTGAKVVVLCQSVGELPECGDYIGMIDFDIRALAGALAR